MFILTKRLEAPIDPISSLNHFVLHILISWITKTFLKLVMTFRPCAAALLSINSQLKVLTIYLSGGFMRRKLNELIQVNPLTGLIRLCTGWRGGRWTGSCCWAWRQARTGDPRPLWPHYRFYINIFHLNIWNNLKYFKISPGVTHIIRFQSSHKR